MSEDKLQAAKDAAKDEAARQFGYDDWKSHGWQSALKDIQVMDKLPPEELETEKIIDRAMQLYAAECVKDERERIKNAMPSDEEIEREYPTSDPDDYRIYFCRGAHEGIVNLRYRLSQLIERGEG